MPEDEFTAHDGERVKKDATPAARQLAGAMGGFVMMMRVCGHWTVLISAAGDMDCCARCAPTACTVWPSRHCTVLIINLGCSLSSHVEVAFKGQRVPSKCSCGQTSTVQLPWAGGVLAQATADVRLPEDRQCNAHEPALGTESRSCPSECGIPCVRHRALDGNGQSVSASDAGPPLPSQPTLHARCSIKWQDMGREGWALHGSGEPQPTTPPLRLNCLRAKGKWLADGASVVTSPPERRRPDAKCKGLGSHHGSRALGSPARCRRRIDRQIFRPSSQLSRVRPPARWLPCAWTSRTLDA